MSTGTIKVEPDLEDGCWNCRYSICGGNEVRCMKKKCVEAVDKCGLWKLDEDIAMEVECAHK